MKPLLYSANENKRARNVEPARKQSAKASNVLLL